MPRSDQPNLAVTEPFYFPLSSGRYEVKAGLFKFPHPLGNPGVDEQVFQLDKLFHLYREEKRRAREERLEKYYRQHTFSENMAQSINRFLA